MIFDSITSFKASMSCWSFLRKKNYLINFRTINFEANEHMWLNKPIWLGLRPSDISSIRRTTFATTEVQRSLFSAFMSISFSVVLEKYFTNTTPFVFSIIVRFSIAGQINCENKTLAIKKVPFSENFFSNAEYKRQSDSLNALNRYNAKKTRSVHRTALRRIVDSWEKSFYSLIYPRFFYPIISVFLCHIKKSGCRLSYVRIFLTVLQAVSVKR